MPSWSADDLQRIAATDDLRISPFREDGTTYGTPTWIWSVVVEGQLYVRAYNGPASRWYQAALQQRAGRIAAAGRQFEVTFEPVDETLRDAIDAAYRQKYGTSPYVAPVIGDRACAATVRITPVGA